ncbi:unnamed protein product [Protopolystoma xenopodis]|uniref:Uncharacterized protein n=1 Tax=Protopolystoma xenopodis TaxID=117903 RepID=A0A3S5CBG9_9PLAT|nr:unnamed protein product [Protopolystoma xenopodis]
MRGCVKAQTLRPPLTGVSRAHARAHRRRASARIAALAASCARMQADSGGKHCLQHSAASFLSSSSPSPLSSSAGHGVNIFGIPFADDQLLPGKVMRCRQADYRPIVGHFEEGAKVSPVEKCQFNRPAGYRQEQMSVAVELTAFASLSSSVLESMAISDLLAVTWHPPSCLSGGSIIFEVIDN